MSVTQARHFVVNAVADTGVDEFAAALLTSELATNAVRHARSAFRVRVRMRADVVRVSVHDHGRGFPTATAQAPHAEGGRGLWLVQHYAAAWGVGFGCAGKTVWFELPRTGAPAGRGVSRRATSRRLRRMRPRGHSRTVRTPAVGLPVTLPRRRRRHTRFF